MPTTQGRPAGFGQGSVFDRILTQFLFRGVDIAHPSDALAEGRFPCAKNLRAYLDGELRTRPGLSSLFQLPGQPNIHTLARVNDPANSTYTYLIGAGTDLYAGNSQADINLGPVATGLSGKPLTSVVARPDRSPANWAYIANAAKLLKLASNRTTYTWGIKEIPAPPRFTTTPPSVISITEGTSLTQDGNTWNNSVNAGALSTGTRVNTTISYIVYDSGTTGYCGISPASIGTEIQPGTRLRLNSGGGTDEYVVVEQVFALIANTTIESISYDVGNTGLCWIQLATPTAGLVPNCLLRIASAETVRVLEVILDKDNKAAIRCFTTATRSPGDAIAGLRAFRCSTVNNHAAAETITATYIESTFTYPGVAPAGVGNIRLNAARDLSKFSSRPVRDEDEVVVSLYLSDPSKLVEGRVWFDIDPNTTTTYASDDLSRNYLFFPFRADDLQTYASFDLSQTQVSATASNIQRYQFDLFNTSLDSANKELERRRVAFQEILLNFPGGVFGKAKDLLLKQYSAGKGGGIATASGEAPGPFQAGSGKQQWFTLRFKVGQLSRVGQDVTRTLRDTTSVMVNFKFSTTGQVVRLGSWYISGGGNPDMKGSDDLRANAYYYMVQARDSRTGARSLPSAPTRSGLVARRQLVTLQLDPHPNAQVDKLDIYRWGGSRFEFLYLGSANNTPGATFTDNFTDDQLSNAPPINFKTFPPFATVALPFSCQVNVVGPKVTWVSGSTFNTNWSPGSLVELAGRTYITYGAPESSTTLYLTESAGTLTNTELKINSPVVIGNPLPSVFGPYSLGGGLFIFACGDSANPFSFYWTNGNDPDTTSDANYVEAPTNGSELIGGCIYDGRPFLFSADGMFQIVPDASGIPGASTFRAEPVANSRGAVSPTAIASDVYIYFVSKDGIYRSEGGQPVSITNDSLYDLFPHDGLNGSTINGISAPDYTRAQEFTLTTYGPMVYFDYPGLDGNFHTLIYDANLQGWMVDEYANCGEGALVHCGQRGKDNFSMLLGTGNGHVCQVSGVNDIGFPIQGELWLPSQNRGDRRARKIFGDMIFDVNTGNIPVSIELWRDSYQTLVQPSSIIQSSTRELKLVDILSGEGVEALSLGAKLFISSASAQFRGYSWELSCFAQPEHINQRAADWDYGNKEGAEWFQGVLITADTAGQPVTIRAEFDTLATREFTINHDGYQEKFYPFDGEPVIAHFARIRQVSTTQEWQNFNCIWITESYPESSTVWSAQPQGSDTPGWKHLRECWITYLSTSPATLTLTLDGTRVFTYSLPSSGNKKIQYYLPLQWEKCRIWTPEITCDVPMVLFERDTVFHVGPWGRGATYLDIRPFGGPNADNLTRAYV